MLFWPTNFRAMQESWWEHKEIDQGMFYLLLSMYKDPQHHTQCDKRALIASTLSGSGTGGFNFRSQAAMVVTVLGLHTLMQIGELLVANPSCLACEPEKANASGTHPMLQAIGPATSHVTPTHAKGPFCFELGPFHFVILASSSCNAQPNATFLPHDFVCRISVPNQKASDHGQVQ